MKRTECSWTEPYHPEQIHDLVAACRTQIADNAEDSSKAVAAYRRDLAFHNWKYAMWDAHCRLPTQTPSGRSQCFCGSEISIDNVREHVYAAHMDTEQK